MKKLSLHYLSDTCFRLRTNTMKIFFIGLMLCCISISSFAQVTVTPATGGSSVCPETAVSGLTPGCTTLGPIVINETNNGDFSVGASFDTMILVPPAGWQFSCAAPTITALGGGDITAVSRMLFANRLIISIACPTNSRHDQITISSLQIQPLTTTAPPGYISDSFVVGVSGITTGHAGTNFGNLRIASFVLGIYTLSGGGSYCLGSGGVHMFLNGSDTGMQYLVRIGGVTTATVTGTGASPLDLGAMTTAGTYTVVASNTCGSTANQSGSATVTVLPLPVPFAITGGGNYCSGDTGVVVGQSGSVPGFRYYLYNGSTLIDSTDGTGGAISFGTRTTTGTHSVVAKDLTTGCTRNMTGTVSIGILPLPADCAVTGGGRYCAGGTGVHIGLLCSSVGINYQLYQGTSPIGGARAGTGTAIDFGLYTVADTYTVVATNAVTGCHRTMTGRAIITIDPRAPITGTTSLCLGATTTLTNSIPGGVWSSSAVTVATIGSLTGDVNTFATGNTIISYTDLTTGCVSTTTVTVSLLTPITGPTRVCFGDTIRLSNITTGGTWVSSDVTKATVDISTGVVTGVSAGLVTITYSIGGCVGTYPVTVLPAVPAITGVNDLCAWFFRDTVCNADPTGYWSSTLVTVTNIGSGCAMVSAYPPGAATITYTLPTGCYTTATLTVNPQPAPITGIDTVCVGLTTVFSSGPFGGLWTSSNTGVATVVPVSGDILGINAGSAIITYTLPTGCLQVKTVNVRPNPAPIAGPTRLCFGATITLTDSVAGGRWTSSDPGVAPIGFTTGILTGLSVGTATITYRLTTSCLATYDVTVDPVPGAISGPTELCEGATITLTQSSTGGSWISSDTMIATIDSLSGVLNGVRAGSVIITYTFGTGCYSTYGVTVNPLPTPITGDTVVCVGRSVALSSGPGAGTWTSSVPTIAYIDPVGVITGISPGSVITTFTLPTGCLTTRSFTVNPNPDVITGITSLCVAQTVTLSDATTGGSWISTDPAIATIGSGDGLVTGIAPGTVIIDYILPTGCFISTFVVIHPVPDTIGGPREVCVGQTITLTNSVPGGRWLSLNTSVGDIDSLTGVFTGVSAGTVLVMYTIASSCSVLVSIDVQARSPITGPTEVCVGNTIVLDNATPGGIWSSSNDAIGSIDPAGNVLGVSAGTVTITYTTSTLFGGCVSLYTVTVYPLAPIVGPRNVCEGLTITLTNTVPGGSWSLDDPSIGSIDTAGVFTAILRGTTIVTYLLPTGCSDTFLVTVDPLPDPIYGAIPICKSDSMTLTDATTGGVWTSSNTAVATVDSFGVVTGVDAGTATITYTLATGCLTTTTVEIYPHEPITGVFAVCVGLTTDLNNTVPGGTWSSSDITIGDVDTVGIVTGVTAGTVTITYLTANGCQSIATVTVNPLPDTIAGTPVVCEFSRITLTDATPDGTWSSSNITIATIDTDGVVTGVRAGTCIITYMLGTGCIATTSLLVNPVPSPITGVRDVCITFNTRLFDATPGGQWSSDSAHIATIDILSGYITTVSVGVATISYTLPLTGCAATTTVTVHAAPTIVVSPSLMKCKAETKRLNASGAGPGGSYQWTPSYGLSCTACTSPDATPTVTTTYRVIATNAAGCKDTGFITVFIDSALANMRIVGRDSICAGTCDTLTATGRAGTYFEWKPARALSCTICDKVIACPDSTQKYWAVAIDDWGCKDSVSFTVHVDTLPRMKVLPFPTIVCRGTPLQMYAFGSYSYVWSPPYGLSCDSCSNPVCTDTFNMVYNLTGYTKLGCADSIKVKVSVLDTNLNIVSNDTVICIGGSAKLSAYSHSLVGNLDIPTYMWFPSTGLDNPNIDKPTATPDVTTVYSVVITENVCFKDTQEVVVVVDPIPNITITPPSQTVIAGTQVQLTATIDNGVISKYIWTPGNSLSCDTCYNPIATPSVNTTYNVVVTTNHGCVNSDTVSIRIYCDNSQVFIPNTFTPNGDGMNDRFYVSAKGISLITRMSVYNRWGQLVYDAHNIQPNDPGAGWDGQYNGYVVEPDVFVYIVDAVCELGTTYHYQGDISIVR